MTDYAITLSTIDGIKWVEQAVGYVITYSNDEN